MRNLKKFFALILAMMMTFSLMVTVNASSFKDDEDITKAYNEAVDVLTGLKVIQGYEDKTFQPKANITRGEVAAVLYRIVTGDVKGDNLYLYEHETAFKDVYATDWYAPYINFCENNKLIEGVGGNMFKPNDNITGYEALTMILRAIGYDNRNEYRPVEWKTWASGYGSRLGLTANIKAGSLGAAATREVVAEIMFQGIQVPMVSYSILNQYTPILLVDADKVNKNVAAGDPLIYAADIPETLMHQTFGIVGKANNPTFDKFGRPTVMWVEDAADDSLDAGTLYILNDEAVTPGTAEGKDEAVVSLTMTPVATYDNAVTECELTKDINSDKSIPWGAIVEVLNGNQTKPTAKSGNELTGVHAKTLDMRTDVSLDALHTTTKYIGATGRTTEIYKLDQKVYIVDDTGAITDKATAEAAPDDHSLVNLWVFVYVDTFLAKVTDTTPAIKDSASHVIKEATATVQLGNTVADSTKLVELTLEMESDDEYKKGDLMLVQTFGGGDANAVAKIDTLDPVDSPEKAPLDPADVPSAADQFEKADHTKSYSVIADEKPTTQRVTVKATVGARDMKMGIIAEDGTKYMASNTFLAGRVATGNTTVLNEWYKDSNVNGSAAGNKGLTNNMIGKTFDLVLDQNGHIVGLKQVLETNSSVGVITSVDSKKISTGEYLCEIEAYMTDGTTGTFCVPKLWGKTAGVVETLANSVNPKYNGDTVQYRYFSSASEAESVWADDDPMYGSQIGVGSLVKFANVTVEGKSYYKIDDYDGKKDVADKDTFADLGAAPDVELGTKVGKVLATAVTAKKVDAGVTDALFGATRVIPMLNDKSVVFVTEYDYRYNAGDENEGGNVNKTYKVYEGFKTLPTIEVGTASNIVYQRLDKNPQYYLIGKKDACNDYIIKDKEKVAVDESYLLLSRGATYDEYSEYNVLKNGEVTTLKVANGNATLNEKIEKTMASGDNLNQLFVVTGRNSKGYVTGIIDTFDMRSGSDAQKAILANNGYQIAHTGTWLVNKAPDAAAQAENGDNIRSYGDSVLQLDKATNSFLTIAEGCKVKLVNRDLGQTYDITLNEAIRYGNGVDSDDEDGTLKSHGMVFELDELGYVCALYVIDDWETT